MHKALDNSGAVPAVLSVVLLSLMKDQPGVQHARESVSRNWAELSPQRGRHLQLRHRSAVPAGVAGGWGTLGKLTLAGVLAGCRDVGRRHRLVRHTGRKVNPCPAVGATNNAAGTRAASSAGFMAARVTSCASKPTWKASKCCAMACGARTSATIFTDSVGVMWLSFMNDAGAQAPMGRVARSKPPRLRPIS